MTSTSTIAPLRVGLIGAGGIANSHHKGYTKAGASIIGFAEPVAQTRARRELEWGIPGFETLEQ